MTKKKHILDLKISRGIGWEAVLGGGGGAALEGTAVFPVFVTLYPMFRSGWYSYNWGND